MFSTYSIPHSFSLIKKKNTVFLLKEAYRDDLLQEGIADLEAFLHRDRQASRYLSGRTPHLSIPIKDGKRTVIRHYSHGGLLRHITRDLYFFGSRSIDELHLTEEIRSSGIPTIEPIGAIHRPVLYFLYRAYFLSIEVPHAVDLLQYLMETRRCFSPEALSRRRKIIRCVGLLVRQFHLEGFFHGDLQLKNILVAGDQPLLIDFDRSYRKKLLSTRERINNLLRLNRSAEKWIRKGLPITRADRWRFFLIYAGSDPEIRKAMEKYLRTGSLRSILYRW